MNDQGSEKGFEHNALTEQLRLHIQLIREISQLESGICGDIEGFSEAITELLAQRLGHERVSIWEYNEDQTLLECIDLYKTADKSHIKKLVIKKSENPMMFDYLINNRYLDISYGARDLEKKAFVKSYMEPLQMTSLLASSIIFNGRPRGVIAFANVLKKHKWKNEDIAFGCQIADQIGTAFLNRERMEIAKALRQSEAFLNRAQEVSKTGHWHFDMKADRLTWSNETYRIYGVEIGTPLTFASYLDFVHPDDRQKITENWKQKSEKAQPFVVLHRIVVDEKIRWVEERFEFEQDQQGDVIASWGTVQDVTERIHYLEELEAYQKHLEEMVISRTTELEMAKLEAEAASQAKSAFLSNMSHETHSMMNDIIGLAHLIKHDRLTRRQAEQLDKLTEAANRLLQMINDVMDLSKIEAGKMQIDSHDFEPAREIDRVCKLLCDEAAKKNLHLLVDVNQIPAVVQGDSVRFGQILLNLMSNAVKFTDEGSIKIVARIIDQDQNQIRLRFEIWDTGIGISKDQMKNLFQDFVQVDESLARLYGGTGLGLAISSRLVKFLGGELGVESKPGQGSEFWFELPFERSTTIPKNRIKLKMSEEIRVLVIDDALEASEMLLRMLQNFGIQCEAVNSGKAGLEAVVKAEQLENPYRLILLDWKMPHMDGINTALMLQTLKLKSRPSVYLIVGHGNQISEEEARQAGISRILVKPLTPSALNDALMEVLDVELEQKMVLEGDQKKERVRQLSLLPEEQNRLKLLRQLEGFNVETGLRIRGGDLSVYLRLIEQFCKKCELEAVQISKHLTEKNYRSVMLTVHSIKEVAANLGAIKIQELAAELEQTAKNRTGTAHFEKQVNHFVEAISCFTEILREECALSESDGKSEADRAQVKMILNRLAVLLANNDTDAHNLFSEHQELLLFTLGEQGVELERQIRQFDYREALTTVRAICSKGLENF